MRNTNTIANANCDSDCHSYSYTNSDCDCHSYTYGNGYTDADFYTEACSDAKAASNAAASPVEIVISES